MNEKRELKLEDLLTVSGGEGTTTSSICCPFCKVALPSGSGGILDYDDKGNQILMLRFYNNKCDVHTFDLYYSDLSSTGRAWDKNDRLIYKNGRKIKW